MHQNCEFDPYQESKKEELEPKYWTCDEHQELLSCTDPGEAIGSYLDDFVEGEEPDEIELLGYAHVLPMSCKLVHREKIYVKKWLEENK